MIDVTAVVRIYDLEELKLLVEFQEKLKGVRETSIAKQHVACGELRNSLGERSLWDKQQG